MSEQEKKFLAANCSENGHRIGDLNPLYPSQKPELLDPQHQSGEEHLRRNILNSLSPSLLNRNKGPLKGIVVHSDTPVTPENEYDWSKIAAGNYASTLPGYRVYVPEFNQWLKPPEDFKKCSPEFKKMCTKFIATSNKITDHPRPGDLVWVDYLDRENFSEPVYLGKINNEPNTQIMTKQSSNTKTVPSINKPAAPSEIPSIKAPQDEQQKKDQNNILSEHFKLEQLTITNKKNLDNTPGSNQVENLKNLCLNVLEPLYSKYGMPKINSGFRSEEVNKACNGANNSQHTKGQAVDISFPGKSHFEIARWILTESGIKFDQMILENNIDGQPSSGWIHISYAPAKRNSVLSADTNLPINQRYIKGLKLRSKERTRWI